jgi:hypothetical protein
MSIIGDIYEEREDRLLKRIMTAEELLATADSLIEDLMSYGMVGDDPPAIKNPMRRYLGSLSLGIEDYFKEYEKLKPTPEPDMRPLEELREWYKNNK